MPFEKIKEYLGIEKVLEWDHTRHEGLVRRLPDSNSPLEEEQDISKAYAFRVKMGERAIALLEDTFFDDCLPGYYRLGDEEKRRRVEIVWIDTGEFKTNWGIFDTPTKNHVLIGAHGTIFLKVADPKNFILSLVSTRRQFSIEQTGDWIKESVNNIVRQSINEYTVEELVSSLTNLHLTTRAKCAELFSRWGLELVNIEIVHPLRLPEGYEKFIQEASLREKQLELTRKELENKLEEDRLRFQYLTESEKLKLLGQELVKRGLSEEQSKTEAQQILDRVKILDAAKEFEIGKKETEKDLQQKELQIELEKKKGLIELERIEKEEEKRRIVENATTRETVAGIESRITETQREDAIKKADAEAQMRIAVAKAADVEVDIRAKEAEKVKTAEARAHLLEEQAKIEAERTLREQEARRQENLARIEAEVEKYRAEAARANRELDIREKTTTGMIDVEKERAKAEVLRGEKQFEIQKEQVKAEIAQAVAKGGEEAIQAKRAAEVEYFKDMAQNVNVVELERAKALKEAPKSVVVVEQRETEATGTGSVDKEETTRRLVAMQDQLLQQLLDGKISEAFAKERIDNLEKRIQKLRQG